MPWNPSQPAMTSHAISLRCTVVAESDARLVRFEIVHADVFGLEVQRPPGRQPGLDQVVNDLVLAVDCDRASAGQLRHVDAVPDAAEGQVDAVVTHALAREPIADTDLPHQIDRALLEHARAHAFDHVLPAAVLDDDGVDALEMKELPEHQAGGTSADDAHLRARGHGDKCSVRIMFAD